MNTIKFISMKLPGAINTEYLIENLSNYLELFSLFVHIFYSSNWSN